MGGITDYLENSLLNHVLGNTAYATPGTLYFGLSTTTINDAGGNISEPVGNGYTRKSMTNNTTNFPGAVGGSKSNGTAITFPTASGSWGTIVDWFIADAASSGNILMYGTLSSPRAVANGDTASFAGGALTVTAS